MESAPQAHKPESVFINGVETPFNIVARGLTRTNIIGRNAKGHIRTAEGEAIERVMEENAARHARERASQDGLEMPVVFND